MTAPPTDRAAEVAAVAAHAERRARANVRAALCLLLVPAAVWGAVVWGHLAFERMRAADDALRAALDGQRLVAATVRADVAAAAAGEEAALRRLDALAAQPALAALEVAAEPWAEPVSIAAQARAVGAARDRLDGSLEKTRRLLVAGLAMREAVLRYEALAARLLVDSARLSDILGVVESEPDQRHAATRQLLLAQRLEGTARRLLSDPMGLLTAADRLGRDTVVFGEVNNALLNGSRSLDIGRVANLDARAVLERLGRQWRDSTALVEEIVDQVAVTAELAGARDALGADVAELAGALDAADAASRRVLGARRLTPDTLRLGGALALVALLAAALAIARTIARAVDRLGRARRALDEVEATEAARRAELAAALDELADVVRAWARGALDTRPVDASALPGDLAEAVGAIGSELAPVVAELRERGLELGAATATAQPLAARVAAVSRDQGERVDALARAAREMTGSLDPVSTQCALTVAQSRDGRTAVRTAAGSVREALDAVASAHAAVGETAGGVARAAAELRVLRDLVELLDDLAEQAKLLSVNVAIQSSMDSESGRSLANFADDVQRLSDRARQGVRRIETADELLRRLLGEASDAIKRGSWAMDKSMGRGEQARPALDALERIVAGASVTQRALDEAARAHTLRVAQVVRGLKGVQSLATEIRDSAMTASDAGARIEAFARSAARAAEKLEAGSDTDGAVVRFALGDAGEGAAGDVVASNVHALPAARLPPAG